MKVLARIIFSWLALCSIAVYVDDVEAQTIDNGGDVGPRILWLKSLEHYPRQMMMPERCYSACTFALGLRQACITPSHILYFHGLSNLRSGLYDPAGTRDMFRKIAPNQFMPYDLYPRLKAYLWNSGSMSRSEPMTPIDGVTLHAFGVPYCR